MSDLLHFCNKFLRYTVFKVPTNKSFHDLFLKVFCENFALKWSSLHYLRKLRTEMFSITTFRKLYFEMISATSFWKLHSRQNIMFCQWRRRDSNSWPPACKAGALPTELHPHNSGTHLLSHTVSSAVPSAAWVLTVVFGMGTGVSHKRIATRSLLLSLDN